MTTNTLRKKFLQYFKKRDHVIMPSASLVPVDDPSVLFTSAGMQPFKPYFLGKKDPVKDFGSRLLASSQFCIRTSDIEEVGDASHLTFFEMLGNFSLGGYFKNEAVEYGYDFLTKQLHLAPEKLYGTYFKGSDVLPEDFDAKKLLEKYLTAARVTGFPKSENWWGPTGDAGPCGPSTEFHYDTTGTPCFRGAACKPNCACGRFIELWNLVFTEYNFQPGEPLTTLPTKNIDTGMGLERLAMAVQNTPSVYETDSYRTLLQAIRNDIHFGALGDAEDSRRSRIVADHLKTCFFLLLEDVQFSNKDRGYVLRRLYRRAADQFLTPGCDFTEFFVIIVDLYDDVSPNLRGSIPAILPAMQREDVAYRKVLAVNVDEAVRKHTGHAHRAAELPVPSSRGLPARDAFQIYSTYGISPERLQRAGYTFSIADFEKEVSAHQEKSRAGAEGKFGGHGLSSLEATAYSDDDRWRITQLHTATHVLHQALRSILGNHVRQQGSDITPGRLRFDFEHPAKLTDEEKKSVEDLVNEVIQQDLPVSHEEMSLEDALESGALSFFREKYPSRVNVYRVGDFSKEICGGPHVQHSKQIGKFTIVSEKSSAAGVRRIKAVVDGGAAKPES